MHILYRAVPEEYLKRYGKRIDDILYYLIFLEFIERNTDDVILRISLIGDIDGKIIDSSSINQHVVFIRHCSEYSWYRHASK